MTYEEAITAKRVGAYVRGNALDGRQHGWFSGIISEVSHSKMTIRCGAKVRDFAFEDVKLEESRNTQEIKAAIAQAATPRDEDGQPWVILDTKQWTGFCNPGWAEDDSRWCRFSAFRLAHADFERLSANKIPGLVCLPLSSALQRYYSHLETATSPQAQAAKVAATAIVASTTSPAFSNTDLLAEVIGEITHLTQLQKDIERDDKSDREMDGKLEIEEMRSRQARESILARREKRKAQQSQYEARMAGLKAKLLATIQV